MTRPELTRACEHLRQGHVIAYPTEAVWGLGCDPDRHDAVQRILELKQRPVGKGLILVAADVQQLEGLLDGLDEVQRQRLDSSWPGPVTWLIPDPNELIPPWIKGSHTTVAVRVSAHPLVSALCREYGKPVVSTSANRAGEAEIRSRLILEEQFGPKIDFILDGDLGSASEPSEIRDLVSGEIIRG